ncbi:MAG: ABC transporter ATP-binding protein [Oscillospiraceae bacterium]|nr:ABC transporter ATP-binding protein [Oscillospiraceae bacterium]
MKLELQNVHFSYRTRYQTTEVLKGVDCVFSEGQVYGIIGKSGSGKSTVLSLMAGLMLPQTGSVLLDGADTRKLNLETYRREKVAVVYQSFRLLPLLTVEENVMYPMELRGMKRKQAQRLARDYLRQVDLPEQTWRRFPATLSGGEQQRVGIARALGTESRLLLADEPTGNLDFENSAQIIGILKRLAREQGYCVVIVTHDVDVMDELDVIYRMRDGRLVDQREAHIV